MLKVTYSTFNVTGVVDTAVNIDYDGHEFSIMVLDHNDDRMLLVVSCRRFDGTWHIYGDRLYDSVAEACSAIFNGTIRIDRTECGHYIRDDRGRIVGLVPLGYYDRPASRETKETLHVLTCDDDRLLAECVVDWDDNTLEIMFVDGEESFTTADDLADIANEVAFFLGVDDDEVYITTEDETEIIW